MTTGVLPSVKIMDETWVKANIGQLQRGDFVLMAKPSMNDDLIVHTQLDADGDCFKPMNIGHVVAPPKTRDGMGYDVEIALFKTNTGDLTETPTTRTLHFRRAEGCSAHSRRQ